MGFGIHIKQLRLKKRLSAEKLAVALGVSPDRLRKWEEKDLTPRDEDTKKIELVFGMRISDILELQELPDFKKVPKGTDWIKIPKATEEDVLQQKAIVRTLLHVTSKLMSRVYGRDVAECLDELEQTTKINLRELKDGF